VEECGFPGYEYSAWIGVLGRSGAPHADLANMERQLLSIAGSEDARSRMDKQGMALTPKGSAEFKELISRDAAVNRDLIRNIGLKLD